MLSASVAGIGRADAPPRALAQGFPALSNADESPDRKTAAQRACWQNGAMTPIQVSRKTSCFASQLIENTRSRHETSDNFLRCAKTAPNSTSTRQSWRVEIDDQGRRPERPSGAEGPLCNERLSDNDYE